MIAFIALTLALSWAIWIPAVVIWLDSGEPGLPPWLLLAGLAGAWGPTIAALIVTALRKGKTGVHGLVARLFVWRVGVAWWAVALLLFPLMLLAGIWLFTLAGGHAGAVDPMAGLVLVPMVILTALPFGPLGEELGWRGYLQPALLRRMSPLVTSLILGVIWTAWHLPLFWVPGAALGPWEQPGLVSIGAYLLSVTGTTFLFTWLYANTSGSVLLAIVLHLATNASGRIILPMFPELDAAGTSAVVAWSVGIKWALVLTIVIAARSFWTRRPQSTHNRPTETA